MNRRWNRVVMTTALMTVAAALGSRAQSNDNGAQDDVTRLPQISVTAGRTPIEAAEYPGMVTVMQQDEIDLRQASSPDDLLNFIPNVEFTGGPRRTGETPSIRGFSGSDLVILIDGARQNVNAAHDGRFFIDPTMLKEVEVLRGPASALFGSGGTGGVIAFRTLDAADVLEGDETLAVRLAAGYQTVDREELVALSVFSRPTESLDVTANFTFRDPGSIKLGDGSELTRSDDDILSGLLKGTYDVGNGHTAEVSLLSFRNDALEPNVGQGRAGNDVVDKEIESDTARLSWRYDAPANDMIDLDTQVYYSRNRIDETRLDNNGAGAQGDVLKRDVDTLGFRADNRSRPAWLSNGDVTLVYGLEGYRDVQDGDLNGGARDGVPDSTNLFGGVFAQAEFRFFDPFGANSGEVALMPGVRFDYFNSSSEIASDVTDVALSPRLGATWAPVPWMMVFGNYAHAFRAPSFDEAFLDGVHFEIPVGAGVVNRFVANPDLRSQRTRTFEAGLGLNFDHVVTQGDHVAFKATHFRTRATDFIDLQVNQPTLFVDCNPFIPGDCDGTTQAVNIPDAVLFGNEIEASYDNRRTRFVFGYSNLDGDDLTNGGKLGVLTPDQFTLDAAIKFPEQGIVTGIRTLAAIDFDKVDNAADERPGYVVHDIYFAMVQPIAESTEIRVDLGIDNVTDRAYSRVFNDAFEPGRNFKGRLTLTRRW